MHFTNFLLLGLTALTELKTEMETMGFYLDLPDMWLKEISWFIRRTRLERDGY